MGLEADRSERERLRGLATEKFQSDPSLRARLRERLKAKGRELMGNGNGNGVAGFAPAPMPPGLVACRGCGSSHALTDACASNGGLASPV